MSYSLLPTAPETEQHRFVEARQRHASQSAQKRQSCFTLAYLLTFYITTLIIIPALLILSIVIFVKEVRIGATKSMQT